MMRHFVRLLFVTLAVSLMLVAILGAAVSGPCDVECFRERAQQGDSAAQYILGLSYLRGQAVTEALKWFRRSADQGSPGAQIMLADMYTQGEGVPEDLVQAHMWLNLAGAHQGYEGAQELRDTIARKMTAAQIAEAQKLAREWKPKPE
jgi:uncharacterized protein